MHGSENVKVYNGKRYREDIKNRVLWYMTLCTFSSTKKKNYSELFPATGHGSTEGD